MKLTEEQWVFIKPMLPKERVRKDKRGRPWKDPRDVLEGILWILKTGARWQDLPERYPPYQTCHRRYQSWVKAGVFKKILIKLAEHLREKGKINLAETFIDATFVDAKKGVQKSGKPSVVRELKLWQLSTIQVFLSPYPLKVLHHLRLHLLKERFGRGIAKTYLSELSETKLTIVTLTMSTFDDDLESNLLLPISEIESVNQLRMDELFAATNEDGKLRDSFHGFNHFGE
jgi:transposase